MNYYNLINKISLKGLFTKLKHSGLFNDSVSAVLGNGIGNALMLFAGIVIARLLGKDLYGEYGLIKTTMLYIGVFASFGLGTTSTKFIAVALKNNPQNLHSIIRDTFFITVCFSTVLSLILLTFTLPLAKFLDDVNLVNPLRFLALIIVANSINKCQYGILGGFKKYKLVALNNIVSSLIMFLCATILTFYYSLTGALISLLVSQIINTILNYFSIKKIKSNFEGQIKRNNCKDLITFSFPIALQDFSYTLTHWCGSMIIIKFSYIGQLGIYSATSQWYSIVLMIPSLLVNVILSHLSSISDNSKQQISLIKKLIIINFICTFIPFVIIFSLAPLISKLYGESFSGMIIVLRILIFSCIFTCCSNVFNSTLISHGKNWTLLSIRFLRDSILIILTYVLIRIMGIETGAESYAISTVITSMIYFIIMAIITNNIISNQRNINNE